MGGETVSLRLRSLLSAGAVLTLAGIFLLGWSGQAVADVSDNGTSAGNNSRATPVVVNKVVLTTADSGPTRMYRATVFDTLGRPVKDAVLDIGGLSDDPDVRVATKPMIAFSATAAQATVVYPAPGPWVVVVRVHAPSQYVHLGSENITGVAEPVAAHNTPSRQALQAISPNLGARLTAAQNGTAVVLRDGHTATGVGFADHALSTSNLNASATVNGLAEDVGFALLHLVGVALWLLAVGSVALAGRAGNGALGSRLLAWITPRYALLAGGGLAVVVITGLANLRRSAPDGLFDGTITSTNVGRLYVGALALKMGLVAASALTSFRLGSRLRLGPRLESSHGPGHLYVGAAQAGAVSHGGGLTDALLAKLAVRNVVFAAAIIGCVNVMNQASHLLH